MHKLLSKETIAKRSSGTKKHNKEEEEILKGSK